MKKVVAILMLMVMLINNNVVFADSIENDDLVTITEYENAIIAEGKKYGIDCKVISYNPQIKITKQMLSDALDNVKLYALSVNIREVSDDEEVIRNINSSRIVPYLMPVTKDYYRSFRVENIYGFADMRLDANITTNIQNDLVMSVNSFEVYQLGLFSNFVSWTPTNISYQLNYPKNGDTTFTIKGRASFSYADPFTGVTTGYTSNVNQTIQIDCS